MRSKQHRAGWPSVLGQHDAYSERAAVAEEAQAANSAKAVACKFNSGAISVSRNIRFRRPERIYEFHAFVAAKRLSTAAQCGFKT